MLLLLTSCRLLIKQVHKKTITGTEGVPLSWRNKQLHSPGMRNWKGKLCSPATRVPVKEEGESTTQYTQIEKIGKIQMSFMVAHIVIIHRVCLRIITFIRRHTP